MSQGSVDCARRKEKLKTTYSLAVVTLKRYGKLYGLQNEVWDVEANLAIKKLKGKSLVAIILRIA